MITHVVLCRFKAGITPDSDAATSLDAMLKALPTQISDILEWRCGFNTTPDPAASDYLLYATFADRDALNRYFEHPAHLAVVTQALKIADLSFADI
ncbi:Dabb family protein [Viridibacterium curvum]|uniref:Dabb family protein n=1 Tax=Viridibacterium curvum TaxID=1101404 RepID=A0ABP9QCG4_9RHOO